MQNREIFRNPEKKTNFRYQLSKKESNYHASSQLNLLFSVDQKGQLVSEFEIHGHTNETPDIQKSDGEFADLIYEKTVRK